MRGRLLLVPALIGALSACKEEPAPVAEGVCNASELQDLVGRPDTVLDTMRFSGPFRVIRPGTPVTMDYRQDRLNIEIDLEGRIVRVYCG